MAQMDGIISYVIEAGDGYFSLFGIPVFMLVLFFIVLITKALSDAIAFIFLLTIGSVILAPAVATSVIFSGNPKLTADFVKRENILKSGAAVTYVVNNCFVVSEHDLGQLACGGVTIKKLTSGLKYEDFTGKVDPENKYWPEVRSKIEEGINGLAEQAISSQEENQKVLKYVSRYLPTLRKVYFDKVYASLQAKSLDLIKKTAVEEKSGELSDDLVSGDFTIEEFLIELQGKCYNLPESYCKKLKESTAAAIYKNKLKLEVDGRIDFLNKSGLRSFDAERKSKAS